MQKRPIRAQLYVPITVFGVNYEDWKFILLLSGVSFLIPVLLGIKLWGTPLALWTGIAAFAGSVAFFNFIRLRRPRNWLQHQITALQNGNKNRGILPRDLASNKAGRWII